MYKTKKEIAEALNYYSFAGEKVQKAITEDDSITEPTDKDDVDKEEIDENKTIGFKVGV